MEQRHKLLDILFYNTGSTTAILEGISGQVIEVEILEEKNYNNQSLSKELSWANDLILRITKLKSSDKNLSYNIVLYDPKQLEVFEEDFSQLSYPIGKILEQIDSRRIITRTSWQKSKKLNRFFDFTVFLTHQSYPVKEYYYLHDSKVLFYIFEIYDIENIEKLFLTNLLIL